MLRRGGSVYYTNGYRGGQDSVVLPGGVARAKGSVGHLRKKTPGAAHPRGESRRGTSRMKQGRALERKPASKDTQGWG